MVECEEVLDASEPLRQGDVLRSLGAADDPWSRLGIVVTANCDLVHRKHAGAITTVPVLRYDEYLGFFPVPARLSKVESTVRGRVRSQLRRFQSKYRPDFPHALSDETMDGWIASGDPDAVLSSLRATADQEAHVLRASMGWLRDVSLVAPGDSLAAQLSLLARGGVLTGAKQSEGTLRASLVQESVARVKSLPGDALFLHSLGPTLTDGYVVYLRRVANIEETAIALRSLDSQQAGKEVGRISRLASPYIFRLTQQLAQVFADIGLPEAYEASRGMFVAERTADLQANP
jgi:hypothetical protein